MKSTKSSNKSIAKIAGVMALALALLAAGLFLITRDDSPASKLLRQGNDAFAAQNYLDALGAYELAQSRQPELAEPFYNAANALYREGSFGDAVAQIQQALLNVADEELAQHSFYNLGNAAYNGQDLETAVQSYIDALLINPNDADAKYNLELACNNSSSKNRNSKNKSKNPSNLKSLSLKTVKARTDKKVKKTRINKNPTQKMVISQQESESGEGDQESRFQRRSRWRPKRRTI